MNNGVILPSQHTWPGWLDFLIVLGAIALLSLLLFFWVLVFHQPRRHRKHRHHHHHHHHHEEAFSAGSGGDRHWFSSSRRRRRRLEHRPLTPTLAQTGGLPPIRDEKSPPPPPPPSCFTAAPSPATALQTSRWPLCCCRVPNAMPCPPFTPSAVRWMTSPMRTPRRWNNAAPDWPNGAPTSNAPAKTSRPCFR